MKLRIWGDWDNSENLTKRLLRQFKTEFVNLDGIEFVYDNSYDVIIFFNYVSDDYIIDKPSFIFPHEPTWSGTHQKNFINLPNATVMGLNNNIYLGNYQVSTAMTFYGGRGEWLDSLDFWCYDNLKDLQPIKTKNISSVITTIKGKFTDSCLYDERYRVGNYIKENCKFIDMFGGWGNKFDEYPQKKDSLIDYKFNLIIENEYTNNWITEKFYDCILTNTVPIYYGCKNIKDLYPYDGYILINDLNNLEEIEKMLIDVENNSEEIYQSKLKNLQKIKQDYFYKNNLLLKILNLIK